MDAIVLKWIGPEGHSLMGVPTGDLTQADLDEAAVHGHTVKSLLAVKPPLFRKVKRAKAPKAESKPKRTRAKASAKISEPGGDNASQ